MLNFPFEPTDFPFKLTDFPFEPTYFPFELTNFPFQLTPVPHEEAVGVEPVGLLPIKEGRLQEKNEFLLTCKIVDVGWVNSKNLSHGSQPQVPLGDLHLATLTLGSP